MQSNLKLKNKLVSTTQGALSIKNAIDIYRKKGRSLNRNSKSNRFRVMKGVKKKTLLSYFKVGLIGRPYRAYKFFLSKMAMRYFSQRNLSGRVSALRMTHCG